MKMMKMLTLISILFKTKTLALRVLDDLLFKTFVCRKVRQVALLAKETSKMTVKKAWVWEWATDKAADTM